MAINIEDIHTALGQLIQERDDLLTEVKAQRDMLALLRANCVTLEEERNRMRAERNRAIDELYNQQHPTASHIVRKVQ